MNEPPLRVESTVANTAEVGGVTEQTGSHPAAHVEEHARVAVVGVGRGVFTYLPAEVRERQEQDAVELADPLQVRRERAESLAKLGEQDPVLVELADVGVE